MRGLEKDLSLIRHPQISEFEVNHITVLALTARHSLGDALGHLNYISPYHGLEIRRKPGGKVEVKRSCERSPLGIMYKRIPIIDRFYELRAYIEKLITQLYSILTQLSLQNVKHFVYLYVETAVIHLTLTKNFLGELIAKLSSPQ
jgi:hypothetical protein